MAHFAFLGTGLMGAPMVRRLAVAGYRLRVWNRSSAKADACRGPAIDVCRSPAEALQGVETLFLCLTDAKAVSDVVFTDPEALLRWGVFYHCGRFLHHRHGRDASICGQPGECQRRHLDRRTGIGRRRRCHLWNPRHFRGGNGPSIERVLRRFALWRDASRIWPPWVAESHIAARRADWRVLGLDPQKQTGRFPDGSLPKMETAKWI